MARPAALTVIDPTSLGGREVVDRLVSQLPELRLRFLHTASVEEHLIVESGGQAAIVPPLTDPEELDGSLAVVVTSPLLAPHAPAVVAWLRANPAVSLLECGPTSVAPDESVTVLGSLPSPRPQLRWYHLLDPSLIGPARAIAALAPLEPTRATVMTCIPASQHGEQAVEELAKQATARLSGYEPRRRGHLPGVMAFDLAPAQPGIAKSLDRQLENVLGAPPTRVLSLDVGVFHGNIAALSVSFSAPAKLESARAALGRVPDLRMIRRNQRVGLSEVVGSDQIVCTDLSVSGCELSTWLMWDGWRAVGTMAADLLAMLTAS